MIGMEALKQTLGEYMDYQTEMRRDPQRDQPSPDLNMVFLGNPGTGKTTMARMVGKAMFGLGLLKKDVFVEVGKAQLAGQHCNNVGTTVTNFVNKASGGVLFIDEVYALAEGNKEVTEDLIGALVPLISNRTDVMFIIAGYTERTREFFAHNPGLDSRFPSQGWVEFADYSLGELRQIFLQKLGQRNPPPRVDSEAEKVLTNLLTSIHDTKPPSNGRGVEKLETNLHVKHVARIGRMRRDPELGDAKADAAKGLYSRADFEAADADIKRAAALKQRGA